MRPITGRAERVNGRNFIPRALVCYREQGISGLGVGQAGMGASGVNVVGGSLCMDSRSKASLSSGAGVLWELEVSGRDALRVMHFVSTHIA